MMVMLWVICRKLCDRLYVLLPSWIVEPGSPLAAVTAARKLVHTVPLHEGDAGSDVPETV